MLLNPTTIAKADQANATGTPLRAASSPQTALPIAIPPCSTRRYMDRARARIHDGHMVCATTLKQARIPIHAAPAVNNTPQSHSKACTCPAAKVIAANTTVAAATRPSTEYRNRRRGSSAAPARAPTPKQVSRNPYPCAPCGWQISGSRASREVAPTLNAPVRISTDRTCGARRTYRKPSIIASRTRWVGSASWGAQRQRHKNKITPKKDAAFSRNDHPDPAVATTMPPRAGPTARATLNPAEFSATAEACRSGETTSGVIACHAGSFKTAPTPRTRVKSNRLHGVTACSKVSTPSPAAAATIQLWVNNSNRRRSTMSASAPAGSTTKNTGTAAAAWTRLTINGEVESCVISQPAPTFCIHVPVYETTAAIHNDRNSGSRNGAHAASAC